MKKIYLTLFIFVLAFTLNAQTTLTSTNHAPLAGETYTMYQCDSTGILPGGSGAGNVWNFSAINTHSNLAPTMSHVASTNTNYPNANISLNNSSFLKTSSSIIEYYGGIASFPPVAGSVRYGVPAISAIYPMSLNTTTSTTTSGTIVITSPTGSTCLFTGNSSVTADGTGTVILPGNSSYSNCVRINTVRSFTFNTILGQITVSETIYEYYSISDFKAPIFGIYYNAINSFQGPTNQVIVLRNKSAVITNTVSTSGIAQNLQDENSIYIFPNPASYELTVLANNNASHIMLYDMAGRLVNKLYFENGQIKHNIYGMAKGLYQYSLINKENIVTKQGKFNVD